MANALIQHASGMATSLILRELRGVPEECPKLRLAASRTRTGRKCRSTRRTLGTTALRRLRMDRQAGSNPRPREWPPIITREGEESDEHSIMTVPLRTILRPGDPPIEPLKETETGPPEPVVYFAYGSNMSTARLRKRMPSCKPLGIATLPGHALRFHKRSKDKSGKCNAFASGNDNSVIGVLFSFDPAERAKLDEAEGVGAAMSTRWSRSSTTKVAGGRSLPISPLPTTSTTASNPMAGTRTLSLQVQGTRPAAGVYCRIHPIG